MSLTCPRCSIPMTEHSAVTEGGPHVSVDICPQCAGLWLDAQKLSLVCPTVANLPARKTEVLLTGEAGANIRVCPRCTAVPYEFAIMEDMKVDFCPQCSGVWLDGDEYQEGAFVPAEPARERDVSPYRSAGENAEKKREATCQDCARPVTVATSFVWEYGFLCRSCFGLKQQRSQARRVADSSGGIDLVDVISWLLTPSNRRGW